MFEQSQVIVVITKQLYKDHIRNIMWDVVFSLKSLEIKKQSQLKIIYWSIAWDRVTTDETHTEMSIKALKHEKVISDRHIIWINLWSNVIMNKNHRDTLIIKSFSLYVVIKTKLALAKAQTVHICDAQDNEKDT